MHYFVTGGAGFIGREVVRQLLQGGHNVWVYDDFSFGRRENLRELIRDERLKIIKGKIENHSFLVRSMKNSNPNVVIHLAALHFIPYCNVHPLESIKINVEGTYSVFEASIKSDAEKVLFASSGALYESVDHPLVEGVDRSLPVDVYGCSKLLGERICEYFSRVSHLRVAVMRFFNTYGPYETNEHLIPEIMKQLHEDNTIQLGNVNTKRDYIFNEDLARAVILLSQTKSIGKFEIVNIGTSKEYSALELVEIISKLLDREIKVSIDKKRLRKSDKLHQIADLTYIKSLIDWEPKINLDVGIRKLLEYESII